MATYDDFQKLDIRVGRITKVEDYPEAHRPSDRLEIDFGNEIGSKKSIGQFPANYSKDDLLGKQIIDVVNFPPRQIGPAVSEVLTLGVPNEKGEAILLSPDTEVPLSGKLF
jgi:tRNA-binding protein